MHVICTIVAKNYLAHARTLCESYLEHHPGGRSYVLIVDDYEGYINPIEEHFTLVSLSQIRLPEQTAIFCFKYNVTELATAVKPFFLRWLFETKAEGSLFYLDPDILVTAPLDDLQLQLDTGSGLILTPHLDKGFPDDGLLPDDRHIMISGIFNLGFLGIRFTPKTWEFLSWLEGKLTNNCVIDFSKGLFVDQKFFDLAYNLFPFDVECSPGYNVAYWNLHSRILTPDEETTGRWLCNGEILYFFHFSSYKPTRPEWISSHMNRYKVTDRPDLQPLFADYRKRLMKNGYEKASTWPYSYGYFNNGTAIPDSLRNIFRRWNGRNDLSPNFDPFADLTLRRMRLPIKWLSRISLSLNYRIPKAVESLGRWMLRATKRSGA